MTDDESKGQEDNRDYTESFHRVVGLEGEDVLRLERVWLFLRMCSPLDGRKNSQTAHCCLPPSAISNFIGDTHLEMIDHIVHVHP